ncbi:major facilitator superfamily domain-containing protein [Aspergillus karnatakaensis]|uniref:major facilitator superfamily domain-containing protein n=1 Tax=Aspergillus karnatakaensis TaxID=1810916 RepID=UPI003CCCE01D
MQSIAMDSDHPQVDEKHPSSNPSSDPLKPEASHLEGFGACTDHDEEALRNSKMTVRRMMSFMAMAVLWTGSQIPVYLFGGIPPIIYRDIGVLANLLAEAAICPFVGSLSDLFGRRYVALIGAVFSVIGMIVCATAQTMNIVIAGMALAGAGAGVSKLTALAATSEMAPTRLRGKYVAFLIFTITSFAPSVLWAQLIADAGTWRHVGTFCANLSRREIIHRVDFVGGFLSISGLILFLAGMQWGGYQYSWYSAHVLVPLLLGAALLLGFVLWEIYGAKSPLFPSQLKQEPKTLALTLVITFISGANFFSVIMFWPTQAFNVYGHDPIAVGELLIASSILMTAGCGALAVADMDNINTLWGILVLAGLGIGGIVVPASIMITIICPHDLIATVSALTLSIRLVGGMIGYAIYYNIFVNKFTSNAAHYIGGVMTIQLNITDPTLLEHAIELTSASLLEGLHAIPGITGNQAAYDTVVRAGQIAFAESYKWVYYVSIGFGGVSIIAAAFLGSITQYMDDHVAVVVR